jgi:hypothetical protein
VRRILIDNIVASNASPDHGIMLAGLPGHPIEDVVLSNLQFHHAGGGTAEQAAREVPQMPAAYPDPDVFGVMPSWGLFARHVKNLRVHHVELRVLTPDARPAVFLEDAAGAGFRDVRLTGEDPSPRWSLREVTDLSVRDATGLPDTKP